MHVEKLEGQKAVEPSWSVSNEKSAWRNEHKTQQFSFGRDSLKYHLTKM